MPSMGEIKRLQGILEANPVPTIITRMRDGLVRYANASAAGLAGLAIDDIVNQKTPDFFLHPEEREPMMRELAEKGVVKDREIHVKKADGTPFWALISFTALEFEGEPSVVATIYDITERKQAEEALQSSEQKYRALIENSNDAIFIADADTGTIVEVNPKAEELIGLPRETLIGMHQSKLHPPEDAEAYRARFRTRVVSGEVGNDDIMLQHSDGHKIPVNVSVSRVELNGKVLIQGMFRDITERKQVDKLNEKTSEILEMAVSEKPVSDIYDAICLMFEGRHPGLRASILKLRGNQLFHGGAPSLPDAYMAAIDGAEIGPSTGSCGTAAFLGKQVIVENISADPLWDDYKELALSHGLQSCWSEPIKDARHRVLGTFAMYYDHPCRPDEEELLDINRAAGLAALVMERENREASLHNLLEAIEQANESIMLTDRNGIIEYVNAAFTKISGYSASEAIGKNPRILKSGKKDASYYEKMWKTITTGEIWKDKVVDKRKDGSLYPVLLTISPIFDRRGEITHFVGIHDDVSEIEKLEDRFYQAQKMEAIGTLAGGIAHDFNNMLAGMLGTVYLVRDKLKDRPEVQEKLQRVEKTGYRAAEMISQLLTFARKGMMDMQPVALTPFLKEAFKLSRSSVPENISFTLDVPETECTVKGDATLLQQALLNLISNARHAVAGQTHPEIRVSLDIPETYDSLWKRHPDILNKSCVRLTVHDNGYGIAEEVRDKLFDPFFTTKEVGEGTGLGLAMVYGAVQSHDGVIEVESEEGKGSAFHIFLPLAEQAVLPSKGEDDQVAEGHGETILLADDEPTICEVCRELLESIGYRLLIAANGEEAVRLFGEHQDEIRLAILDVVMPQMGGVDAAHRIRASDPDFPIIFQTGYGEEQVLGGMKGLKHYRVVNKPASIPELSRMLREMLDGKHTG